MNFCSRSRRKPDLNNNVLFELLVQSVAVCFSLLCVGHAVSGQASAAQSSPRIYVDWLDKNVK
jgi:hypothetical protein